MSLKLLLPIQAKIASFGIIDHDLFNLKGVKETQVSSTLFSEDCPMKYFLEGFMSVAVIECMSGSLMCFTTTGIPYSQMNIFLSSEVETNFLLLSIKVTVFTAPRCSSYCWVLLPLLTSY